jgi:hypothetical protein
VALPGPIFPHKADEIRAWIQVNGDIREIPPPTYLDPSDSHRAILIMDLLDASSDDVAHAVKALAHGMRVPRQHRLDAMPRDLGQIGVVDAGSPQVRDLAVAALVGADVQAGGFLGRTSEVAGVRPVDHNQRP